MVKRGWAPILSAASSSASACLARADADRLPPAAPRQLGQRGERRLRPAEVIDELAEGDGADVVAADQSQAGQALGGIERRLRQRRRRQPGAGLRLTAGGLG